MQGSKGTHFGRAADRCCSSSDLEQGESLQPAALLPQQPETRGRHKLSMFLLLSESGKEEEDPIHVTASLLPLERGLEWLGQPWITS